MKRAPLGIVVIVVFGSTAACVTSTTYNGEAVIAVGPPKGPAPTPSVQKGAKP